MCNNDARGNGKHYFCMWFDFKHFVLLKSYKDHFPFSEASNLVRIFWAVYKIFIYPALKGADSKRFTLKTH